MNAVRFIDDQFIGRSDFHAVPLLPARFGLKNRTARFAVRGNGGRRKRVAVILDLVVLRCGTFAKYTGTLFEVSRSNSARRNGLQMRMVSGLYLFDGGAIATIFRRRRQLLALALTTAVNCS